MLSLFDRGLTREAIKAFDINKVLFIVGPRKSGKTQLINELLEEDNSFPNENVKRFNCDVYNVRKMLDDSTMKQFQQKIERYTLIIIEEAQHLGQLDKLFEAIVQRDEDSLSNKNQRIVITLSQLAQRKPKFLIRSKLTYEIFHLYPISILELADSSNDEEVDFDRIMRFGLYPEVWQSNEDEAVEVLREIASQYLYRDLLELDAIKKPSAIGEILRLLALNIGSEISMSKISKHTGLDDKTVERYINYLIEAFIVFRVRPLNRRGKSEVKVRDKYYFWDIGIRNALLDNFGRPDNRVDKDQIWENVCIAERQKANFLKDELYSPFFWRTHGNQEISYVEEEENWLVPYKFSWNEFSHIKQELKDVKTPPEFKKLYGIEKQSLITQETLVEFLKQ